MKKRKKSRQNLTKQKGSKHLTIAEKEHAHPHPYATAKARSAGNLKQISYETDTPVLLLSCYQATNFKCATRDPIDHVKCKCNNIYPDEILASAICKKEIHTKHQVLGQHLVARKFIPKDTVICQYKGKFDPPKTKGMYVAKLTARTSIDAESFECLGKYTNHYCAPNVMLKKIAVFTETQFKTRGRGERIKWRRTGKIMNYGLWQYQILKKEMKSLSAMVTTTRTSSLIKNAFAIFVIGRLCTVKIKRNADL